MKAAKVLQPPDRPLLGAHFSIAKGLHNALVEAAAHRCNALQIFTKNANSWKERSLSTDEIRRFEETRVATGIGVVASHTSYLINLAGPDNGTRQRSLQALKNELVRSSRLGIEYVVLHPGAHKGSGLLEGIERIADGVNRIFAEIPASKTRLLFETTAGQGSSVGHRFEQLAMVLQKVAKKARIGICLDSCHIFAAGYDIRTERAYRETMAAFEAAIGLRRLRLIHLNDSKKGLGSHIDRHAHIGRGEIGKAAFGFFMNDAALRSIPKIIETPKKEQGKDWDAVNLKCLRDLLRVRRAASNSRRNDQR